jgi:hypothetical protein
MTEPGLPIAAPTTLDYTAIPPPGRISKFSLLALLLAIVSSPCLLSPLSSWINLYLPQQFREPGGRFSHFAIRTGVMVVATLVSALAYVRARASRGAIGTGVARAALIISIAWWVVLLLLFILVLLMALGWQNDSLCSG